MRMLLACLACLLPLSVSAQSPKRAIIKVTTEQSAVGVILTVTCDDGLTLVIRPTTAGAKQADVADVLYLLNLMAGKLPSETGGVKMPPAPALIAPQEPPKMNKPPQESQAAPNRFDTAKAAMAAIIGGDDKTAGTAILVGKNKLVTTAPLGDAKDVRLRFPGGAYLPATVTATDRNVTILSILEAAAGDKRKPIDIAPEDRSWSQPATLTPAYMVGSPYGPEEVVGVVNVVNSGRSFKLPSGVQVEGMTRLDATVGQAAAGSAVVNDRGELVAIACVWPRVAGTWAVPASMVDALKGQ